MAEILLVGCGSLGMGLAAELVQDGHRCYGLRRSAMETDATLNWLQGDVTVPDSLDQLPAQIDYLVYTLVPTEFSEAAYRQVYVEGLRNLIQSLHRQSISLKRLFFISSTSVYGQHHGEWVDEHSDTNPGGFSGQVMLEAERLAQQSGYATTRIRFSGIYGPGRERLLNWARNGARCPAYPPHYSNRIHQQDCIGVLKHLIEMNESNLFPDDVYLATDSHPSTYHEVLEWLGTELGQEAGTETVDMAGKIRTGSKRCSNQRLLNSGYELRHPDYRSGFAAQLAEGGSPE